MADQVVETHCSTLFFVDDRVYKRKKPLDLGFLDFRTVESRRRACEDEVALNRRLAPDAYLGVATVLAPDGSVCDTLVVMRRLPDDRRLSHCVEAGEDVRPALNLLAEQVAALHRSAPAPDRLHDLLTPAVIRQQWDSGLDALVDHEALVPAGLREATRRRAHEFLDGRADLLADRLRQGRLVDGHGDLLADDVFLLPDGPRALDCLEFDERLRVGDGLADAAFLAMDLERLGRPDLARAFLDSYEAAAGDAPPSSLEHHYLALRAHIRCKVACLRHAQTGDPGTARTARSLAELALRHLEGGRVTGVVVGGLPGAGKSTVARAIGKQRGWLVLSTDEIRQEVGAVGERYSRASRDAVYGEVGRRARLAWSHGQSCVLDGTFALKAWREVVREAAARSSTRLVELRCEAPLELAAARTAQPRPGGSEATPAVVRELAAEAEPWPEATAVLTTGGGQAALEAALDAMRLAADRAVLAAR